MKNDKGGNGFYYKEVEVSDPKRPLPDTRKLPAISHLKFSLTLGVIRGDVRSTLGPDVDAQLGLLDYQDTPYTTQQKYLDLIEQKV